jgi:hypothetical protein
MAARSRSTTPAPSERGYHAVAIAEKPYAFEYAATSSVAGPGDLGGRAHIPFDSDACETCAKVAKPLRAVRNVRAGAWHRP